MGLDKILPALTCMDVFLLNVEGFTNGQQLLRAKNAAIVRDEALRSSKLLDGRIQDNEHTRQILALKDITGENRSREGIHDGNHVKRTLDVRDAMFFDVADIDA